MRVVFLDRDGVINHNRHDYVKCWEEFRFVPGSKRAIAHLTEAGYRIVVVTNQACVGKGLVSRQTIEAIHRRMVYEIGLAGGRIEAILWCAHRAEEGCSCRKPAPGLLYRSQQEYGIDLARAIFVGDSANDLRAAEAAQMPSVLVLTGLGLNTLRHASRTAPLPPHYVALNLAHAAHLIMATNRDGVPFAGQHALRQRPIARREMAPLPVAALRA